MTDVETALAERRAGRVKGVTAVTGRHLPALNGLRAVAVIGVVAYHLQLGWARGGYLGVDLFFVLSGFLITTLLLEEWVGSGRIDLAAFWGRRARRLLPALFLVVGALAVYLVVNGVWGGAGANGLVDLSGLRGDAISTLLYVNNWHSIFVHQSYFAQFSTPSPLQHTWSLAIEEQFYLVWPLLLLVLLRFGRRGWRGLGVVLSVGLGVLSSILMAVLFTPGADPSRVYYGTDTRLFDLMAGATIAFVAAARPQPNARAQRTLHVVAPLAAVALLVFWVFAGTSGGLPTNFMFESGFLVCAALAGLVVADARLLEPGRLARGLAWGPLHFLGTISYGIYLWHWPVIVYVNGARTGLSTWPLDLLRVVLTLALSTASYYLIERPIRLARLHGWVRYCGAPLAGLLSAVLIVTATFPAVADPATVAGTTHVSSTGTGTGTGFGATVAGAGGLAGQALIHLAAAPSAADPLRVMVLGDSVLHDASFGMAAALGATGEATVDTRTIDGFGLTTATDWPTSIPTLIRQTHAQVIVASWSWDQDGPTTPNALHQPAAYTRLLRQAVATMLAPGDGVEGVIFTEFPQSGEIPAANPADQATYNAARTAGVNAWNDIAKSMSKDFPGRVMYFPLAGSVLLDGRYSAWLPPEGDPHAPSSQWTRVRKLDKVHLCSEGSARYAAALLVDMTQVFGLAPAAGDWSQGSWALDPSFNDPPGACPDDHPPGG
ncbi:MAG TPA: acyltransferase [Acidimicrobiales bacterium]|nr:acyltransferase [Acidimicrobiales bacterium]